MAYSYDEEKQLLDIQAKCGQLTLSDAQDKVRELMEAEADRLDKMAGAFWQERELSTAYRTKAKQLRDSIEGEQWRIGGTADERKSLHKVVTAAAEREHGVVARLGRLEKVIANDPMRRPIGMPARSNGIEADLTKAGPLLARTPHYRPSKPTKDMNRAELAVHYTMLSREAATSAEAHELLKIASELQKES